jgi:hypothetical protein
MGGGGFLGVPSFANLRAELPSIVLGTGEKII